MCIVTTKQNNRKLLRKIPISAMTVSPLILSFSKRTFCSCNGCNFNSNGRICRVCMGVCLGEGWGRFVCRQGGRSNTRKYTQLKERKRKTERERGRECVRERKKERAENRQEKKCSRERERKEKKRRKRERGREREREGGERQCVCGLKMIYTYAP